MPESLVEDGTHEVFVVVHRRWADWDRRSKITTWLYGIARGVARNALRTSGRADRKLQAVEAATSSGQSGRFPRPDGRLDRADASRLLADFLDTLDPGKREAFRLCAVEGLTSREAGACLGESPNTISTRVRRARMAFEAFVQQLQEETA